MRNFLQKTFLGLFMCVLVFSGANAQRKMEKLGRGVVATRTASSKVLVSWRLLGTEPQDIGFNVYRSAGGGSAQKLNSTVLTAGTNFEDTSPNLAVENTYTVKPVRNGQETEAGGTYNLPANSAVAPFFKVPIRKFENYHMRYMYVGDLDGDGEYDFIVHKYPKAAPTDVPDLIEAYKRDGTLLWVVDMGPNSINRDNISPGASALHCGHGDNMTVYDINCDGKAEVILRTANGVKFADGSVLNESDNNKQFISIVNGLTGSEMSRIMVHNPYLARGPMNGHMGIAYLDGVHPSIVLMGANRNADLSFNEIVNTWNWTSNTLVHNWFFDLAGKKLPTGHQIKIFDIDGDGKDEIVPQAFALDDDGTVMYNLGEQAIDHGDRFVVADLDPSRPGLEIYGIQQGYSKLGYMWYYCDAKTGKLLMSRSNPSNPDMARGMTGDFDPRFLGHEFYTFDGALYNVSGAIASPATPSSYPNQRFWWDGDLGSEILDDGKILKWDYLTNSETRLYTPTSSSNGAGVTQNGRYTPGFYGDILGDWREEAIYESGDNNFLVIITSPHFTEHRIYTLPHNPGYRSDMAVKGYYQSNNPDFYLGYGMQQPPIPPIQHADKYWLGGTVLWDQSSANWSNGETPELFSAGDTVMFDIRGNNSDTIRISANAAPGRVWLMNPENKNYIVAEGSGKLTGAMDLVKAKPGSFTLVGNHDYTGETLVTEGQFNIDGSLQSKAIVKGLGSIGGRGKLLGGLILEKGVNAKGGRISPGLGNTNEKLGTLSISGSLSIEGDNNFEFDILPGSGQTNDSLMVTGDLLISGTNRLILNFKDNNFAPGTYSLISCDGTLTATADNFKVEGIFGVSHQLLIENNTIKIQINPTRPSNAIVWKGQVNENWNFDTENFALGAATTAFVSGDEILFDSTAIRKTIKLDETVLPASVTFRSDSSYTLSGSGAISGSTGLLLQDSSNVNMLLTGSTYTGKTIIKGSTLTVGTIGLKNEHSSLGAGDGSAENIYMEDASLIINEKTITDRAITLVGNNSITTPNSSNYAIFNADITGSGSLAKEGPGGMYMVGAKTFSGPVTIRSGSVNLRGKDGNINGLGGSGEISLENASLNLDDVRDYAQIQWNLTVPEGKTGTLRTDGRSTMLGTLKGAGTLNVNIPYIRTDFKGNWSQFSGTINIVEGDFRIANASGYANAALRLSGGKAYSISGGSPTIAIGELSGADGTSLGSDNSTANWIIGAKNTDATFAGRIGKSALTKVGTGTFTVTGNNTYSGNTSVNAGRLIVNNPSGTRGIGAGTISVASGAVLGGTGFIKGAITLADGATIQPGSDGIGTLTDSTSIVMNPGATAEMDINKSAGMSDVLKVTGTMQFDGRLLIHAAGNAGFMAGDSFKLFDAESYNGSFASIEPASPGEGLKWDMSDMSSAGVIKISIDAGSNTTTYYWKGAPGTSEAPAIWSAPSNWNTSGDGSGQNRENSDATDILTFDGSIQGTDTHFITPATAETISTLLVFNSAKVSLQANGNTIQAAEVLVNNGRLLVNDIAGSAGLGSGPVTVTTGGELGGNGHIAGAVSIESLGKIQPGNNGIGTLTVGSSITLGTTAIAELELNKTAGTADQLKTSGTIQFDGKLIISKLGSGDLTAGDHFKLFDAATYSGTFKSVEPAIPGSDLMWDLSELLISGTVKVAADLRPKTYYWRGSAGSAGSPSDWSLSTNWSSERSGTSGSARNHPASNDILVFDGNIIGTRDYFIGQVPEQSIGSLKIINAAKIIFTSSVYPSSPVTDAFTSSVYGGCTYTLTGTTGSFVNLKPGDVITTASSVVNPMPYAQVLAIQDDTHITVSKESSFPSAPQTGYYRVPTLYTDTLTVDAQSTIMFGAGSGSFRSFVLNTKGGTVAGAVYFSSRGGHHKLVCTTPNRNDPTKGLHFTNGASLSIGTSTSSKWNYNLGNTLGLYKNGRFIFDDGNQNNNMMPGYGGDAGIVFEAGSTFTMGTGEHYTPLGASYAASGDLTFTPAVWFKPASKYVNNSSKMAEPFMVVNNVNVSYPDLEFQAGFPTNLNLRSVQNLTVSASSGGAVNTGSLVLTGNLVNSTANTINFGNVMLAGNQAQAFSGTGPIAFNTLHIADQAELTLSKDITAANVHLLGDLNFGDFKITGTGIFATYAPYSKNATSPFILGSSAVGSINDTGAGTLTYQYPVGATVSHPVYLPERTVYRSFAGGTEGMLSSYATGSAANETVTFSVEGSSFTTNSTDLTSATPGFNYLLNVNAGTLPVAFVNFTAQAQKNGSVLLKWNTSSEKNNSHFEMLRSNDGKQFHKISETPGINNSIGMKSYQHTDYSPLPGMNYYQLKQVDRNGASSLYPEILAVDMSLKKRDFIMYVKERQLNLQADIEKANAFNIYLTDMSGKKIAEFSGNVKAGTNSLVFPMSPLPAGIYVASYISKDEKVSIKLLISE